MNGILLLAIEPIRLEGEDSSGEDHESYHSTHLTEFPRLIGCSGSCVLPPVVAQPDSKHPRITAAQSLLVVQVNVIASFGRLQLLYYTGTD